MFTLKPDKKEEREKRKMKQKGKGPCASKSCLFQVSGLVEVWLSAGCSVVLQNYETVSLEDFHTSGRWFILGGTLTSGILQKLINRYISLITCKWRQ